MANLIDKDALAAEIKNLIERANAERVLHPKTILAAKNYLLIEDYNKLLSSLDTLEVKDHYEQCIQYDSIKAGIKAHAKTYSFNIGSVLFQQLTKEQQALWRKEIEQACISGGEVGLDLARDPRYKENLEVKEVDLEEKATQSTTEDLGEYINEISKQFPEVSFAKLSRIAVRAAEWQKEQIKKAMDLGEPPYLISVEQAYYRTLKLLEE